MTTIKYSSRVTKTFKFSVVRRTCENTDVFSTLDENIYSNYSKSVNILYIFHSKQACCYWKEVDVIHGEFSVFAMYKKSPENTLSLTQLKHGMFQARGKINIILTDKVLPFLNNNADMSAVVQWLSVGFKIMVQLVSGFDPSEHKVLCP